MTYGIDCFLLNIGILIQGLKHKATKFYSNEKRQRRGHCPRLVIEPILKLKQQKQ